MGRQFFLYLLFLFFSFANLTAAGEKEGDGAKNVALITMDSLDEHWLSTKAGAEQEIAKQDSNINLTFLAPPQKADPSDQVRIVEDAINRRADGIILAPTDQVALVQVVKKVKESGIPLVLVDSPLDVDDTYYLSFISTDNYHAGELAGERLGQLINGQGKVAIINAQPGAGTIILREQGFYNVIERDYPGIEVVATQYSNGDKLLALNQANDILRAHPDLAAFYTTNEGSTVGTSRALAEQTRKVFMVGFDKSNDVISGVRNGVIDAVVVQNPTLMGSKAIDTLIKYWQQESGFPKQVDTGARVIDKSNLDTLPG